MRVLADRDISYVYELFGKDNRVEVYDGRVIIDKNLKQTDILIVRSVTKVNQVLLHDSVVKFVGSITSGTDHIDKKYLKKSNIKFVSAPGSNAISVVEYVFSALLWLANRYHFFLRDKTIGIVGVGYIGSLLHERLSNFGVHTLLCDPYVSKTDNNKTWKSLEKLVAESDILTFHTPLTRTGNYPTWHMINADVLDALPTNSILINTARGSVIDNNALLNILKCGKKINVVLDVWESEPFISLPLLSYVDIGTAHIAGYTLESKIRSIMQVYNEYCNYFNISNKVCMSCLLPVVQTVNIKRLDEICLNRLINSVYNIYDDYLSLKDYSVKPGGFDALRRCHYYRREWSSMVVNTNYSIDEAILTSLGFNTRFAN